MACITLMCVVLVTVIIISYSDQSILNSTISTLTPHELTESEIELFTANFTSITADAPKLSGNINKTTCFCGTSNTPRLQDGEDAYNSEFPWMVYLTIKKATKLYFCAGFLITNKHVLSSAICTSNAVKGGVTVYLGGHSQNITSDTPAIKVSADSVLIHPQFNKPSMYNNDIAIIKLKYTVRFTENIRPICQLPKKLDVDFNNVTATLTGLETSILNGTVTNALRKATVPMISDDECKSLYKKTNPELKITSRMICAGKEEMDVCQGDKGGPLMITYNNRYYAAGIVSLDFGCGSSYYPGIYTRLTKYRNFVNRYTANGLTCKS